MIEIKSRWDSRVLYTAKTATDVRTAVIEAVRSGAYLAGADLTGAYLAGAYLAGADLTRADLAGADLTGADLTGADLTRAYLAGADLTGADLTGADLTGADLTGADLTGADLTRANLTRAIGVNKYLTTPLYMLLEQTGKIRAYKLVDNNYRSPIQTSGKLTYKVGDTVEVKNASTDERAQCAAGVNVATLDWCIREWKSGYRILVVEFDRKDIACIPVGSDGKFRVHRCKVISEKDMTGLGVDVTTE